MPKVIRFAGLLLAAGLACGTAAAGQKKPSTLTEQEIRDGWISLFDRETTFGWKVEGEAVVKDGTLIVGGVKVAKLTSTSRFGQGAAVRFTYETPGGAPAKGGRLTGPGVHQDFEGTTRGRVTGSPQTGQDGPVLIEVPAGQQIVFREVSLKTGRTIPLLNGKDLTGWNVFQDPKRSKSKFEVTPAGELRVTNGPGDLQTEGKYADFVLQLECKTNGKNLNSGVFFRCVPDQYQNGYEAQIHNGYKDDRTKPIDFGTGAVYRRVPARRVVSDDNEWFTMTVVANGPHISTWVNGYQTVDWTDERKPADNPRQGLRTAAGHISIQGHDPTTDILFRNIRIAELKK